MRVLSLGGVANSGGVKTAPDSGPSSASPAGEGGGDDDERWMSMGMDGVMVSPAVRDEEAETAAVGCVLNKTASPSAAWAAVVSGGGTGGGGTGGIKDGGVQGMILTGGGGGDGGLGGGNAIGIKCGGVHGMMIFIGGGGRNGTIVHDGVEGIETGCWLVSGRGSGCMR